MIRRFLIAWRIASQLPRELPQIEWLEPDRRWLRDVFNQPSGQKLRLILDNAVNYTNKWAVQRPADDAVRACGFAAGVSYMLSTIELHLPQVTAQRDISNETAEYGAAELVDLYSP